MPTYDAPSNDMDRHGFLARAINANKADVEMGNQYLGEETVKLVNDAFAAFGPAYIKVAAFANVRSKEIRERNAAMKKLSAAIRDIWGVLRRRTRRKEHHAEVFSFYQLPLNGASPMIATESKRWLTMAKLVIQGDADAVAAGYEPMTNPDAAEIQALLDTAQKEADDVPPADRQLDQQQEALAELRPTVDEAISEVMADLRHSLRKLTPPSRRRIMRSYGATFTYQPDEAEDEGDAPSPDPGVSDTVVPEG